MKFKQFLEMRLSVKYEPESSKDFISKLLNIGRRSPLNPREVILNNEVAVEVSAFDGVVWLKSIRAFKQGEGNGTRAMKLLCDLADGTKSTLCLEPMPFGTTSKKKLIEWYKRFGFVLGSGGTMERWPILKLDLDGKWMG